MTAESLKAIADLYFFLEETEDDLDICLAHYEDAIEMIEDLGMGGNKESVLTLKNFAMCHMRKNNFDEAMKLLTKAEQVSEQELEADHTWKVMVKTELAILHDKMGNPDQAKDVMLEGLLMGKRLKSSIDKMGNKDEIREFINRYPETFSEEEFPRNVRARTIPQANETWVTFKGPKHVTVDPKKFRDFKRPVDAEKVTFGPGGRGNGALWRPRTGAESGLHAAADAADAAHKPDSRPSE